MDDQEPRHRPLPVPSPGRLRPVEFLATDASEARAARAPVGIGREQEHRFTEVVAVGGQQDRLLLEPARCVGPPQGAGELSEVVDPEPGCSQLRHRRLLTPEPLVSGPGCNQLVVLRREQRLEHTSTLVRSGPFRLGWDELYRPSALLPTARHSLADGETQEEVPWPPWQI